MLWCTLLLLLPGLLFLLQVIGAAGTVVGMFMIYVVSLTAPANNKGGRNSGERT